MNDVRGPGRAGLLLACLLSASIHAHAQQAGEPSAATPNTQTSANASVPTLDKVQALRPEEEVLDLYTFKNPVTVNPNAFRKAYDTGITPEAMALHYGGYVNYGINQGLLQTWKGFKKLTHMRPHEQSAIARPPPLSEEQLRRMEEMAGTDRSSDTKSP